MAYSEPPAWRNLRVGVFFLVSFAILVASLLVVGTNTRMFERKYELVMYLPNAQQLDKGAMVALAGLEVGRIKNISLVEKDGTVVVQLKLLVPLARQAQITSSSVASVRTVGVLGDRFIDITIGDPNEAALAEGSELQVDTPTDWPATFQRARGALDDFLELIAQGAQLIRNVNEGDGTVAMLLNDPIMADGLRQSAANLSNVTGDLRDGKGTLGKLIKDPLMAQKMDQAVTRLDSLLILADSGDGLISRLLRDKSMADAVSRAIAGTDSFVLDLQGDGTLGKLARDDELYVLLTASADSLRALMADIKKHPEKYLDLSLF